MPRPLIIRIDSSTVQPNKKATGSIDIQLLKENKSQNLYDTYSNDVSSADNSEQTATSVVRNLITRYETKTEPAQPRPKPNLLKYKSKSLADLQIPRSPKTEDAFLYNHLEDKPFNFKRIWSKFETFARTEKASNELGKRFGSRDDLNLIEVKRKAKLLLDDHENGDGAWEDRVVEFLEQIVGWKTSLRRSQLSLNRTSESADCKSLLEEKKTLFREQGVDTTDQAMDFRKQKVASRNHVGYKTETDFGGQKSNFRNHGADLEIQNTVFEDWKYDFKNEEDFRNEGVDLNGQETDLNSQEVEMDYKDQEVAFKAREASSKAQGPDFKIQAHLKSIEADFRAHTPTTKDQELDFTTRSLKTEEEPRKTVQDVRSIFENSNKLSRSISTPPKLPELEQTEPFIQYNGNIKVPLKYFGKTEDDLKIQSLRHVLEPNPDKYITYDEFTSETQTPVEEVDVVEKRLQPGPTVIDLDKDGTKLLKHSKEELEELTKHIEDFDEKISQLNQDSKVEGSYINEVLVRILVRLDEVKTYGDELMMMERRKALTFAHSCIQKLKEKIQGLN